MSFMNRRDSVHDIILATAKNVNVFLIGQTYLEICILSYRLSEMLT